MKKLLLLCASLALVSIGHAKHYPDSLGICYKFENDKLISRGTCIMSSSDGDGGYISLDYQGKQYLYDVNFGDTSKSMYYRDVWYDKTKWDENISDELLRCHKDKDYDICFLHSN